MKKLLIHNNNIPNLISFNNRIKFISIENTLKEIEKNEVNIFYIRDSLSENYLDFYGLILAYHIRLSPQLKDKRFLPIVILTDLDGCIINKFSSLGQILFTKNIFINQEPKKFQIFNEKNFNQDFLNKIIVKKPKDTSTNHDISNEWAIYKWAEFLKINDSKAINDNKKKISSLLYFKYLVAQNLIEDIKGFSFLKLPKLKGKILYIDDEWEKGWGDVFETYFSRIKNIDFNTFKYTYKDKDESQIINNIEEKIISNKPDIVMLDLRLTKKDHENINIESITGIKILDIISNINKGIQVIIFTASNKSIMLETLYDKNILGYIQKEHPTDINISTKNTFEKFKNLIDKGFNKSYLKEIWTIQADILDLDIMKFENDNFKKIKSEINMIFDILNSNLENKMKFTTLTIFKVLEIICDYYIYENRKIKSPFNAYWKSNNTLIQDGHNSTSNKLINILNEKLQCANLEDKIKELSNIRNSIIHSENKKINITKVYILEWFKVLQIILNTINIKK
jgi:CheY-like chemotaxis protein